MSMHIEKKPMRLAELCLLLVALCSPAGGVAAGTEPKGASAQAPSESVETQRIYRTSEEQREAGMQTEITPWLTLSGLLEGEIETDRFIPRDRGPTLKARDDSATLQLGLIVDLFGVAEAETVVEYDSGPDKFLSEEAFITFEFDPLELSLGKQFTPLGLYFSRFVTGPMLEFGETSARKVVSLTYGPSDDFDLTLSAYRGRVDELGEEEQWDWAVGFEAWLSDSFSFGLSYQSDLADSDEGLLEDDHTTHRVPVSSGYILGVNDDFEFSFEIVAALDDFRELEKETNRPLAWNAEVVCLFPQSDIDLAFRLEKSRELEDEPEIRYGVAITWYMDRQIVLTLEYLHGQYDTESYSIEKEEEITIQHVNTMGAKLSVVF